MSDDFTPDLPPDDISYEDFESVEWAEPEFELEPIDLDALDDDIEPVEHEAATEALLGSLSDLNADIDEDAASGAEVEAAEGEDAGAPDTAAAREDAAREDAAQEDAAQKEAAAGSAPDVEAPAPEPDAVEDDTGIEPETAAAASISAAESAGEPQAVPAKVAADRASADEAPAPVVYMYRVLVGVAPDLAEQVERLRATAAIIDAPPPGIDLAPVFRTGKRAEVESVLADWARNHLPFQLEITGVVAEVRGGQQYIAAWTLEPQEELREAQYDLIRALAPLINPLPDQPVAFPARVVIGDHILVGPYPRVIREMQQSFEPFVWHAETVALVQRAGPTAGWEATGSFW